MHLHNCVVRLAGNLGMTVHKSKVTAPEIILLRADHGDDAVIQIEAVAEVKRALKDEYDRLVNLYGVARVTAAFPGAITSLPRTLAEAGIEASDPEPVSAEEAAEEEIVPLPAASPALPASVARKLGRGVEALV